MKRFGLILMLFAFLLPVACRKPISNLDPFKASIELSTPIVKDGGKFEFVLSSNRQELRVVRFQFDLVPDWFTEGETITLNSQRTFSRTVEVPSNVRDKLVLEVEDVLTGLRQTLSVVYTAYANVTVEAAILNDVSPSSKVSSDYPFIVDGDDFRFVVTSSAKSLKLESFVCEFNDGQLEEGREYEFDEDGKVEFCFRGVSVTEDAVTFPTYLKLNFLNPITDERYRLSCGYLKSTDFMMEGSFVQDVLRDGSVAEFIFYTNRSSVKLDSYSVPDWLDFKNISRSGTCTPDQRGSFSFDSYELTISSSEKGVFSFTFEDSDYTCRKKRFEFPYETQVQTPASSVMVDRTSMTINNGETACVNVSTAPEYSVNRFRAKVISGNGAKLYSEDGAEVSYPERIADGSFKDECTLKAGKLYIRGNSKSGKTTIRVSAVGNVSAYQDITVSTRQDVCFILTGKYFNNMYRDASLGNAKDCGWYGFVDKMEVSLVECPEGLDKNVARSSLSEKVESFRNVNSSFSIGLSVRVNKSVTSRDFYAVWKVGYDIGHYFTWSDKYYSVAMRTLPSDGTKALRMVSSSEGPVSYLALTDYLNDLDSDVQLDINGYPRHADTKIEHEKLYIFPNSVSYDSEKYNLKYFLNLSNVAGFYSGVDPWWAPLDTDPHDWLYEF